MRAWHLDAVARFAEKSMSGDTLRTCRNKFSGTGTSQFKVTTTGAGEVSTWEVLKTGLRTIACLEAGFVYWYVGVVVIFTNRWNRNFTDRKTW